MATTADTYQIKVDVTQAQQALNKLNSGLERTGAVFGRLKTTLLGVGFAAFAKGALNAAAELNDLAESSGIAADSLYGLSAALQTSGGNAEKLPMMISTFAKSIDEAAEGSLKAQNVFRELGISIADLGGKGSADLLAQTVRSLADMEDPVRRTALQMQLLGKGAMTLSPEGLRKWADEMANGSAETQNTANAIKRAGELNDNFNKALFNLKIAFVEAFEPAINLINDWSNKTENGTSQLQKMVTALKLVGVAMSAVFASSLGYGFVKIIGMIGRGFISLRNIMSGAAVATGAVGRVSAEVAKQGIFRAAGPHMNALRAIVVVMTSIGAAIATTGVLFDNLWDSIANGAARAVEEIGLLAAEILNLPTDAIAGILNLFGAGIKNPAGLGDGLKTLVENARKAREEYEAQVKAQKEAAKAAKDAASSKTDPTTRPVDTTEYDKAINKAKQLGEEYIKQNEAVKNQIMLDSILIGKGQEESEMIRMRSDLYKREEEEIRKLTDAKENLSAEEKKAGVGAEYDRQIELIKKRTAEEEKTLEMLVKQKQEKQRIYDLDRFGLEQQIASADKLRGIQSETAQLTMGTLAKAYKEIEDAAENTYQAKLAEARLNNQNLSQSDIDNIRKSAYAGVAAQKAAKKEYYDASRSFNTGWSQAFNEYVENATNAAEQARQAFQMATKGMEDLLINFAKTGKFEFKSFINDIVEMLLRSEIQRTMASIFSTNTGGTGGGSGNFFSSVGKLLGFANGGIIPHNGPVVVGERGPEILSGVGGRSVTPNNQLGGSTNITYNIQAVDARSFQQLVASDPEFIYAVTLKGQRSMPGGR